MASFHLILGLVIIGVIVRNVSAEFHPVYHLTLEVKISRPLDSTRKANLSLPGINQTHQTAINGSKPIMKLKEGHILKYIFTLGLGQLTDYAHEVKLIRDLEANGSNVEHFYYNMTKNKTYALDWEMSNRQYQDYYNRVPLPLYLGRWGWVYIGSARAFGRPNFKIAMTVASLPQISRRFCLKYNCRKRYRSPYRYYQYNSKTGGLNSYGDPNDRHNNNYGKVQEASPRESGSTQVRLTTPRKTTERNIEVDYMGSKIFSTGTSSPNYGRVVPDSSRNDGGAVQVPPPTVRGNYNSASVGNVGGSGGSINIVWNIHHSGATPWAMSNPGSVVETPEWKVPTTLSIRQPTTNGPRYPNSGPTRNIAERTNGGMRPYPTHPGTSQPTKEGNQREVFVVATPPPLNSVSGFNANAPGGHVPAPGWVTPNIRPNTPGWIIPNTLPSPPGRITPNTPPSPPGLITSNAPPSLPGWIPPNMPMSPNGWITPNTRPSPPGSITPPITLPSVNTVKTSVKPSTPIPRINVTNSSHNINITTGDNTTTIGWNESILGNSLSGARIAISGGRNTGAGLQTSTAETKDSYATNVRGNGTSVQVQNATSIGNITGIARRNNSMTATGIGWVTPTPTRRNGKVSTG